MRRSRKTLPLVALLALAGCGDKSDGTGPGQVATERFAATFAGTSVVPVTTATSTGRITLDVVDDSLLRFSLNVTNMTGITQAHLHTGASGANGAILAWLLPVNGTAAQSPSVALDGEIAIGDISPTWIRGTPRLAMDSVKALARAGRLYVDVHTSAFPNGEVRGQIAKLP